MGGKQGAESAPEVLAWAADVLLTSCCIGEAVSRPIYDALIAVTARHHRATLLTRDSRAAGSYGALGVEYELVV